MSLSSLRRFSFETKSVCDVYMVKQKNSVSDWIKPIEKAVTDELNKDNNAGLEDYDGSHDMSHFKLVSALSQRLAKTVDANELVCYAAGMLHDIVNLPKNHPNSGECSRLASERAREILTELDFPEDIDNVCHAILTHSYSAEKSGLLPSTLEAKCVQDADRMNALGAFGLMRTFHVSGGMGSKIMDEMDPGAKNRPFNDRANALDHFKVKLDKLYGKMKTDAGKEIAQPLSKFLDDFYDGILQDFEKGNKESGRFQIAEVYHKAGRNRIALFNFEDPLANKTGRVLEPEKYALDGLLKSEDPDILKFIKQFEFEINGY